jgi:FKBP-type peptidyl-prolyl cis-trans isomerase
MIVRKSAAFALAALLLAGCNQESASAIAEAESKAEYEKASAESAKTLEAGKTWLAENAKVQGVVTLPSGVQYRVVREGPAGGQKPSLDDEVTVHYEGRLIDGKVFDSSYERGEPATFPLRAVIPGWAEAVQHMKVGDEFEVVIPPDQGYGPMGKGEIPGNSVLIFKLELLKVLSGPAMG